MMVIVLILTLVVIAETFVLLQHSKMIDQLLNDADAAEDSIKKCGAKVDEAELRIRATSKDLLKNQNAIAVSMINDDRRLSDLERITRDLLYRYVTYREPVNEEDDHVD